MVHNFIKFYIDFQSKITISNPRWITVRVGSLVCIWRHYGITITKIPIQTFDSVPAHLEFTIWKDPESLKLLRMQNEVVVNFLIFSVKFTCIFTRLWVELS